MEASCDVSLLLIVHIALQNELDNVRAQLSQKGELARDMGPWEASDLSAGGRGPGKKASIFWWSQRLSLLCVSESLASSVTGRKGEEREVTKAVHLEQVSLFSLPEASCPGLRLPGTPEYVGEASATEFGRNLRDFWGDAY